MRLRALTVVGLFVVAACGDGTSPNVPRSVTVVGGNNQSAALGDPIAIPLTVLVTGADNRPFPGARVTWTVTSGSASVAQPTDTTDANGESSTSLTIGVSPGNVVVTANVTGVTPATFQLTALDPCENLILHTVGTVVNAALTLFDCAIFIGTAGPFYTDLYRLTLPAQQAVTIEMAAVFDTYLEFFHINSPFLGVNDDVGGTNTNSRITFIGAAGDYVFAPSTFDISTTGPYSFTSSAPSDALVNCPIDPLLTWITRGVALTQQLEATDCVAGRSPSGNAYVDRVLIVLDPSRPLTVTMASGAFNPRIELYILSSTAPGSLVTAADGVAGSAQLTHTPASGAAIYRIDFTSVDTVRTGAYTANVLGTVPASLQAELPLGAMFKFRADAARARRGKDR